MGNQPSSPPSPAVDHDVLDDGYEWPENLFVEMRDMASVSFLVYTFAFLTDAAREYNGLEGLKINDTGRMGMPSRDLPRSFGPSEIIEIIEKNRDTLNARFPDSSKFDDSTIEKLRLLEERAELSGLERPLTLEEFDDRHQTQDLVYGVTKDDIQKRITLVFRGTENKLARKANWLHNLSIAKKDYEVPDAVKHIVDRLRLHSGFGNYMFDTTHDDDDDEDFRKYDEIVEDVKLLLKEHPDYKIYVTGHSLGAALSTVAAFYLTCDPDIPKPVTLLNFASPRVGGKNFLEATRYLEKKRWLRILRVVNDNDSIAAAPLTNYHHVGFQCRLFKETGKAPTFSYPSETEGYGSYAGRLWQNSLITSLNFGYDHGDYRERVDKDQLFLVKYDLGDMYEDTTITGFVE